MTACLREKSNFLRDTKEIIERPMAEIDNFSAVPIGNDPIEKRHLAENFSDIGGDRKIWQVVRQLRSFVGQVEGGHGSIMEDVEFGEQPRNQRLSDTPKWGTDHVKWNDLAGHAPVHSP